MSTKKRFLGLAAGLLLLAGLMPTKTHAQSITYMRPYPYGSRPANIGVAADDVGVAFLVQYIGAQQSGTIQVSSGDVLFKHGVLAAEIADTTITGCGGTAGTLDVDNAACNTLGELVTVCNVSTNWRCVPLDGLKSDATASATLLTLAATQAKVTGGLGVTWDTSVALHETRALVPVEARSIEFYLDGTALRPNPFQGTQTFFVHGNETVTYASGTSFIRVYETTYTPASATDTEVIISNKASGATTVLGEQANYLYSNLMGTPGRKLLYSIRNSAALGTVSMVATAYQTPSP